MSTRVQKGGTVFKPVARAKSRAVSAAGSSVRQSISVTETCTTPHSTATSPRPSVEPNAAGEAPVTPRPTSPPPTLQPVPERAELDVPPALQSRNTLPPPITRHPRAISTPARPPDRPPTVSAGPSISSSFRSTESHVPLGRNTEPSSPIPLPEPSLTSKPPLPSSKATAPSSSQLPPPPLSEFQLDFSAIVERAARAELFSPTHGPTSEPQIPAGSNVKLGSAVKLNTSGPVKPTHPARKRATSNSVNGDPGEDIPPKRRRTRTKRSDVRDGQAGDSNAVEVEKSKPRTRRATRVTSPSHLDDEGTPKARKRTTSRQTRSSSAPFDSNVDPGEELDPTVVTMADICEDTGQGRVSSKATQIFENHAAWKRSNRERRAQMRATMEARKYGHNGELDGVTVSVAPAKETEDGKQHPLTSSAPLVDSSIPQLQSASKDPGDFDEDAEGEDDGFDYSKVVGGSRFAARVRIGANGETVIDESSLFIDRTEEHETENYTHVEESDATKFTNSSTYSRRCHGSRWSGEETELFYDALRQFGENYELISFILPGRDRKACKNKFKAEDKKNPARINYCLANRVPYDMATLSRMTGKDFSGPTPEIRAKTPPNVTTLEQNTNGDPLDSPNTTRKKSRTPGPPEESTTVKRSSNTRKKGKNKEEEGVEILGAADGDWDD